MRILGRTTSINVRKVLWAADELGLAYTREDWGLPLRDPRAPDFLALNPNGQVPVLVEDDGFVLWESLAILRYLAERDPQARLLPAEPKARALADQWLVWSATDLNVAWGYAYQALVRHTPGYDDAKQVKRSTENWNSKMALLDAHLARTGRFVAGDDVSLADIALGLSVHRWLGTPIARPGLAHIARYYDDLRARPAAAPHLDPAVS